MLDQDGLVIVWKAMGDAATLKNTCRTQAGCYPHLTMLTYSQRSRNKLTSDVVILPLEELQPPQVGAELLELERELDIPVRLVAVQQGGVGLVYSAALHLTSGDQVDSVELLLFALGGIRPWTDNVHLVPNLRGEDQTLTQSEAVKNDNTQSTMT